MSHSPPCSSSSPGSPPQVILDDRDTRITYYGSWTTDLGEGSSHWGNSFNDTAHRSQLSSTPSNITFSFKGTAFSIIGGIEDIPTANTSSSYEMVQSCIIDGQTTPRGSFNSFNSGSGSSMLCGADGLADAEHEVMFTAHATGPRTSGFQLSVDAVQYTPSAATNATMMIDACDTSLSFENHWTAFDPPTDSGLTGATVPLGYKTRFKGVSTNQHGAQVTLDFEGTKVIWMSTIPSMIDTSIERNPARVTFSIHTSGLQDASYQVEISPELVNETQYNHVVYTSPDLSPGHHRLVATYNGNITTVPLTLSYLYVYSASSGTNVTSTSGGPSQGALSESSSHLGAIIGGAVGGFFGLLLVLILGWVAYHRRQRKVESKAWDVVWKHRNRHMQEALEMGTQKTAKTAKSETA